MKWISESVELPRIGQKVLLASPRQAGEFWDLSISCILARHEDVVAKPVERGAPWPTDYYWGDVRERSSTRLVTGNSWWAALDEIALPPGAKHHFSHGYHNIEQIGEVFVGQRERERPLDTARQRG